MIYYAYSVRIRDEAENAKTGSFTSSLLEVREELLRKGGKKRAYIPTARGSGLLPHNPPSSSVKNALSGYDDQQEVSEARMQQTSLITSNRYLELCILYHPLSCYTLSHSLVSAGIISVLQPRVAG
jgi:hypothetical protein